MSDDLYYYSKFIENIYKVRMEENKDLICYEHAIKQNYSVESFKRCQDKYEYYYKSLFKKIDLYIDYLNVSYLSAN